jgi:hypothetical protein
MDFNTTIDLIIKDLNAASEIIDDLKKYPGVPALQVELAKSKCRSAGEVIGWLKNQTVVDASMIEEPVKAKPLQEKQIQEKPVEYIPKPEKPIEVIPVQNKPIEDKPAAETKIHFEKAEPVKIAPPEKKTAIKESEKKISVPASIADKFTPPPDLYEEQISSKFPDRDLSQSLKTKPIKNLSDAIGLNDRFLFISDIFEGNKDSYNQAISRLDKSESLQDAMAIIMSYTGERHENEAVVQLLDLVRLKFPSNE